MTKNTFAVALFSYKLWGNSHLQKFFSEELQIERPFMNYTHYLGWGRKKSGEWARLKALRKKAKFIVVEDGFISSLGSSLAGHSPLSLVIDDKGIYYDYKQSSRLEEIILNFEMNETLKRDSESAIQLITQHRLTKYNHAPDKKWLPSNRPRILVVDQTLNDKSIIYGGAQSKTFQDMLEAAIAENPNSEIWIKMHPNAISGKKKSYLSYISGKYKDIHILQEEASSISVIEAMEKVYVVTSHMGFEALLLGKKVVCFGIPWYSAWGLTDDRHNEATTIKQRRIKNRSVKELFAAAYFEYTRYLNPVTQNTGNLFDVINWLILNKKDQERVNGDLYYFRFGPWRKVVLRPFLKNPQTRIHSYSIYKWNRLQNETFNPKSKIVVWGNQNYELLKQLSHEKKISLFRIEDGFLRSAGLGSDFFKPLSLVLDSSGIYYDPNSNSDLEKILLNIELEQTQINRANVFRQKYVELKMSKYNLKCNPLDISQQGKKIILVPGQVEDDASVQKGSPLFKSNLALLKEVRDKNPNDYILYKEHPDVILGNRVGKISETDIYKYANQNVSSAHIIDCVNGADEIHTLTSLTGFEALLHGKKVFCYGSPFYSGWGLTTDRIKLSHRNRQLSLEQLIYAVFFDYARYVLPDVQGVVSAEDVLHYISKNQKDNTTCYSKNSTWLSRKARRLKAISQMLREEWGLESFIDIGNHR